MIIVDKKTGCEHKGKLWLPQVGLRKHSRGEGKGRRVKASGRKKGKKGKKYEPRCGYRKVKVNPSEKHPHVGDQKKQGLSTLGRE